MKTESIIKSIFKKYSISRLVEITGMKAEVIQMYRRGELGCSVKFVTAIQCYVPSKAVFENLFIERITDHVRNNEN